jgi:hypothetical protein
MKKEDKKYINVAIDNEGFHYCFVNYSDFDDIEDEEFHILRKNYLEAAIKLEKYLEIDE